MKESYKLPQITAWNESTSPVRGAEFHLALALNISEKSYLQK